MNRKLDWPERLQQEVADAQSRPFEWGSHDCALFAANIVMAITGTDVAVGFRGKYKSAKGAYGRMLRFSGGGVEELANKIAEQNSLESIDVAFAQRGDVVLLDTDTDGPALGVVLGYDVAVVAPETGLSRLPLTRCRRAWRI